MEIELIAPVISLALAITALVYSIISYAKNKK